MENKCLNPNCNSTIKARGLCSDCYAAAFGLVRNKRTTWDKLEAQGKSLPKFHNIRAGKNTKLKERALWFISEESNNNDPIPHS